MKKILIIKNIHQSGIDLLKKRDDYNFEIIEDLKIENLKKKLADCDAISLRTFNFNQNLIEASKKLKIISRHGVGYDNVDTNSLKKKGITLAITANANADSVSEHVFFMMLNISRGIGIYDQTVKSGNFLNRSKLPLSRELWNKKILIMGFGRIGKNLIKKCKGFDMEVYVYDPYVKEEVIKNFGGIKIDDLYDCIKLMDYVSVHMPLNDKTKNLINIKVFNLMKKTSIIVNTSRGGIINEIDLNNALNKNIIFGAGLDVFEKEPPDSSNPLLTNKKAFLSPHSATYTNECVERMGKETIQNIIDFFDGKLNKSMIVNL
tara:strand:- start:551 stop:1507 length:957 start_codon:yes stop_codon:yes gene_type:complete